MLEEIYQKIDQYKKNGWNTIIVLLIISCMLFLLLVYRLFNAQKVTFLLLAFGSVVTASLIIAIIVIVKNSKKINKLVQEELLPYMLRQVSIDYQMTDDVFMKEEVIRSLIISRYGSFKSFKIVKGNVNHIPVRFSFIYDIVSTGQSSYDVFSGTYISFQTNQKVDGFVQLRDKGRAEKNKKLEIDTHQYKSGIANRFSDIRFFTSQDYLAEKYFTEELVKLYSEIKKEYKKGFYLTIMDKELVIGIHNRKNLFQFGFFKKLNQECIDKQLKEYHKLNHIINEITKYINDYINN
ncbi:DUF3137 domain-containing protein [Mycoplasmatota bacterium]|nr:DUF3137 domain-containing protein [Mycoplasmatota bacterium]